MVATASVLRAKQAIGKLLAIVGEHLLDAHGASLGQRGEELARRARRRP
jgi:hypothetical protein